MEGLVKWGLIAAGAYVGYEYFFKPATAVQPNGWNEIPPSAPVTVASVSTGPNGVLFPGGGGGGPAVIGKAPAAPSPCAAGYGLDAGGMCTRYGDAQLLANLNSIPWTGTGDLPTEQISRIDPLILSQYASETNVVPGSVLAYMLGLGGAQPAGTFLTGSDGNKYMMTNGVWVRQTAGLSGVGRLPPNFGFRRGRVTTTTIRRPALPLLSSRLQAPIPTAPVSSNSGNVFYAYAPFEAAGLSGIRRGR